MLWRVKKHHPENIKLQLVTAYVYKLDCRDDTDPFKLQ